MIEKTGTIRPRPQLMLRAIILGSDRELVEELYAVSTRCDDFAIYGSHYELPPFDQLIRILNHTDPNVALVEIDDELASLVTMRDIRETNPGVAIVGYAREKIGKSSPAREFCKIVPHPFQPLQIQNAIVRAIEANTAQLPTNLYAFQPAKGGNGATLTAMNVASALAHYWKQKVLVIEADLHSGYLSIALKIEPDYAVVEILKESESLTERTWKRSVNHANGVDWLLTARVKQAPLIAPWEYQRLLTFVTQRYDTVIVDLPEVINDATETIVRRASSIFIVSTPEAPSLYLARRRLGELRSRHVPKECRKFVLNRFTDGERTIDHLEKILGYPVFATIHNDYEEVQRAAWDTGFVDRESGLGRDYFALAKQIAKSEPLEPAPEDPPKEGIGVRVKKLFDRGG